MSRNSALSHPAANLPYLTQ
ncbi:hypothetical protein CGLO_14308 [Colletotrichum gloeosporioides Cg-14]|uniref:Uncharacterized protein n=1 Tax=Colletotrichum gloeosporioides (strain Cg-14) TaxID=1237896 RepID=T0JUK0_COLGC|nr:hypothetical protein CGLO_14308 [Colletotrichum gloeosporioides Cg-14]